MSAMCQGIAASATTQRIKAAQWSANKHGLHSKLLGQGSLVPQFSVTNAVPGSSTRDDPVLPRAKDILFGS